MDESRSVVRSEILDEKWRLVLFDFGLGNHDVRWHSISIDCRGETVRLSEEWPSNESTELLSHRDVSLFASIVRSHSSSFSFGLIESCWEFKENLRPTFSQICEHLRRYLYGSSPIDYSDLDYVDLPPLSSDSISDLASTTILPASTSGIATDSNSHSQMTTTATSSSSLS